jgi:hypothetical protein
VVLPRSEEEQLSALAGFHALTISPTSYDFSINLQNIMDAKIAKLQIASTFLKVKERRILKYV